MKKKLEKLFPCGTKVEAYKAEDDGILLLRIIHPDDADEAPTEVHIMRKNLPAVAQFLRQVASTFRK
jgi:hypothetical protein